MFFENFKQNEEQALQHYSVAAQEGNQYAQTVLHSKGKPFINPMNNLLNLSHNPDKSLLFESDKKKEYKFGAGGLPVLNSFLASSLPKKFVQRQIEIEQIELLDKKVLLN